MTKKMAWIAAVLPVIAAVIGVLVAHRAGVPVQRLAWLLLLATGATLLYLVVRPMVSKTVAPSRWIPFVFDVAFALGFVALLVWVDRQGLIP
jgi:hypothetical protein